MGFAFQGASATQLNDLAGRAAATGREWPSLAIGAKLRTPLWAIAFRVAGFRNSQPTIASVLLRPAPYSDTPTFQQALIGWRVLTWDLGVAGRSRAPFRLASCMPDENDWWCEMCI